MGFNLEYWIKDRLVETILVNKTSKFCYAQRGINMKSSKYKTGALIVRDPNAKTVHQYFRINKFAVPHK